MRKLKRCQWFNRTVATGRGLFGRRAQWNSAAVRPLVFSFLVLHLGTPLTPTTAIADNGAAKISDETSDRSAEIAPPFPANGSTIRIDNNVYTVENANHIWSLTQPDADTLRFELRSGDHFSSSYWTDPSTSERDEVASATDYPAGTQINLSYDFMVEPGATDTANGPGKWTVLGQMHERNVSNSLPFSVALVNGDHMAIDIWNPNSSDKYVYTDPNPIQRGHYYSMDIQLKTDPNGNGFLEVWRDGVQIVDYHGSIGTGAAIYWKQGIYRSSAPETMAVHFRRLKITTVATVTSIDASLVNGGNDVGKTMEVTLHMSEPVTVSGTPMLTLSDGATAIYAGDSGTNSLIFSFTVRTGGTIPEVTGVILPNGATVKDARGTATNLSIASTTR
jgi:Polysaccharide lyase